MKENLPKEQCGMLKFCICFVLFSFSFSLCFLDNAYWTLFPVLAAFVVDCFGVFFLFVQRKWWFKIVKDMLSTSVCGRYCRTGLFFSCFQHVKEESSAVVFIELSTRRQPLFFFDSSLSSYWLLISNKPTVVVEYLHQSCVKLFPFVIFEFPLMQLIGWHCVNIGDILRMSARVRRK